MAKRKYSFLADEDEKYEQEYLRELAEEKKLKENEIKTQLANKGKQGVSMVSGNISPVIGELNTYHIVNWYPDTPLEDRNPENVTWELFRERRAGQFTSTHIKKVGVSSFTFGQTALGGTFRLEAYLHHPEGGGLIIKPKNSKIPKIGKVDLYYVDDKKGDTFSFYDRLRAKAHTTSMFGKEIVFTLWEDDVKGDGHDAKNEAIEIKTAHVEENGLAIAEFTLTKALMKKAMKGEAHAEELEFYVTAEYYKGKIHDSENVNVKNPLYWTPGVVPPPIGTKKPERKPTVKAKKSPAEQKPISKREEKNILLPQAKDYLQHDWAEIKGKALKNKEITVFTDYGNSLVGVKSQPVVKKEEKDKICECEARVRAFMRMLRYKEGTEKEIGYTIQYSGQRFSDMSKHPEKVISAGRHSSSAAGAYQIMTDTWKNLTGYYQGKDKHWHYSEELDYAKKYNITSFDQESQDKFCLAIMKHNYLQDRSDSFYNPTVWKNKEKKIHDTAKEEQLKDWRKRFKGQQGDIIQMIIDNDIKRAALVSSLCWASLPDSPYGQQNSAYTFAIVKAIYEKNLKEELIEPNKELHLRKGFLKEFGYHCCKDNASESQINSKNKCPDNCSQCFDYSDPITNPKINDQSGNKNHNRYRNEPRTKSNGKKYFHSGTDILAAVGTEVHSMMCGEIVHIRKDLPQNDYIKGYESPTSYGNTITIKSKDKNGKTLYHFYAHLSKVIVKVGDTIKHDQVIGLSGSTGNAMHVSIEHRHVHVEAGTSYSTTGGTNGNQRCKINADLNPENYMKSKFDNKGNTL